MKSFVLLLRKVCIILFVFLAALFAGCESITEPIQPQLIIYNGSYQKIAENSNGQLRYLFSFNYISKGTDCLVDGYSLNWSNGGSNLQWYFRKHLNANTVYSINDTLRVSSEIDQSVMVHIQGYLEDDSKDYPYLKADCQMRIK